jgi:hypothetical protein
MTDKPYTERTGGSYRREKNGSAKLVEATKPSDAAQAREAALRLAGSVSPATLPPATDELTVAPAADKKGK